MTNRYSISPHIKWFCFGTWKLEKVKVCGYKQENFWKNGTIILNLKVSLNTIYSTDIFMLVLSRNYVFRVDPNISDYSRLFWSPESGPAERVELVNCQLTSDYPAKEYHHFWSPRPDQIANCKLVVSQIAKLCCIE